jgi:hypothetical protein
VVVAQGVRSQVADSVDCLRRVDRPSRARREAARRSVDDSSKSRLQRHLPALYPGDQGRRIFSNRPDSVYLPQQGGRLTVHPLRAYLPVRMVWSPVRMVWTPVRMVWTLVRMVWSLVRMVWSLVRMVWSLVRMVWPPVPMVWPPVRMAWPPVRMVWPLVRMVWLLVPMACVPVPMVGQRKVIGLLHRRRRGLRHLHVARKSLHKSKTLPEQEPNNKRFV